MEQSQNQKLRNKVILLRQKKANLKDKEDLKLERKALKKELRELKGNPLSNFKDNFSQIKNSYNDLFEPTGLKLSLIIENNERGDNNMEQSQNEYIDMSEVQSTEDMREPAFDLMEATRLPSMQIPGLNI